MMKKLRFLMLALISLVFGTAWGGSITFADLGLENGVQYSDPFDAGDFTVTFSGGGNDGKYYNTGTAIRVYGNGSMTVAAKSGNLTQVVITFFDNSNNRPASADIVNTGTYDMDSYTWTGQSPSVTFTRPEGSGHWRIQAVSAVIDGTPSLQITGTTPFVGSTTVTIIPTNSDYAVYYTTDGSDPGSNPTLYSAPFTITETTTVKAVEEDYEGNLSNVVSKTFVKEDAPEFATAANIAGFKALEDGAEAILTLNNAQVLYVGTNDIYVRDATGAIDFYKTGLSLTEGQVLNGSVIGKRATYNNIPELAKTDYTNASSITTSAGTAEPKVVTVAQAKAEAYYCDLVKINDVKIVSKKEGNYTNIYAYNGNDSIWIYDRFKVGLGDYNENDTYSVQGILVPYKGFYEIYITKPVASGDTPPPSVNTCANIAEFKALEDNTEAKLTLNNAQVLYAGTNDIYVRDASGAIDFYKTGLSLTEGQVLNGSVTGKRATYNNIPELAKTDNTNADNITATAGTAEPKVVTVAQAKAEAYYCDLVKIDGVKIVAKEEGNYTNIYAYNGNDSIWIYDRFKVGLGDYNESDTYSVQGILVPYKGFYEIYVTKPLTSGETPPSVKTCANIAEFKALEDDAEAALTLNNAQVLYAGTNDIYVRDASGAIDFYKTGLSLTEGQVLNGSVIGKRATYNEIPELAKTDNTNADNITATAGTAEPKVVTVAQAKAEAYYCDLVKINDVKIVAKQEGNYTNIYAYNGNDSIWIYDRFKVGLGDYNENDTYSVQGILVPYKGFYEIYVTKPLTSGETPPSITTCNSITEFKALESGTEAKLMLNNAVVLHAQDRDVFVRDASGAIEFYNTGIEFTTGQSLNGSIIGKFSPFQNLPELAKTDNTNANDITFGEATVEPVKVALSELFDGKYLCDLVELNAPVNVKYIDGKIYATDGTNQLQLYDKFKVIEGEIAEGEYNIRGIVTIYKTDYQIYPLSVTAASGIDNVMVDPDADAPAYSLSGQRVGKSYKGIIIRNGKKLIRK